MFRKLLSSVLMAAVSLSAAAVDTSSWFSRLGEAGLSYRSATKEDSISATAFEAAAKDGIVLSQSFGEEPPLPGEPGRVVSVGGAIGGPAAAPSAKIWKLKVSNTTSEPVEIGSLWVKAPLSDPDENLSAKDNLCLHNCISGDASYLYWCRYEGTGDVILMTPLKGTSLEYEDRDYKFYLHGLAAADPSDSWPIPLTSLTLAPGETREYSFSLDILESQEAVWPAVVSRGGLMARYAPGMVVAAGDDVLCAIDSRAGIDSIEPLGEAAQDAGPEALIRPLGMTRTFRHLYSLTFARKGEQTLAVTFDGGRKAYLTFFVTDPVDELIRARAAFITGSQQHRDTTRWYNGLYSLWDMEEARLLSPDDRQRLPKFCVGGSDDPSNSKPVFISEKNVFWPDPEEIAALEYYEDNFVRGKLQRSGDETPYPYGIYGSNNWYENRSGDYGDYGSGGLGRERMWRTFDYTTHIAIFYNLYLIASANPQLTAHPASYWLDMAYNTAWAYFNVPYNIRMGEMWNFHGWCDWAYKQGNFHERYIVDLVAALDREGCPEKAAALRGEWEKKVLYFEYDDPWPFGSEMFVDRTAFESSYYIAAYGKTHDIPAETISWTDRNSGRKYSYGAYDKSRADALMESQLAANLAIRGLFGNSYWSLGTAWSGQPWTLCYMCQMGGTAVLDYAARYSADPARDTGIGYNSILASWALLNTGAWSGDPANYGASGWCFSPYQRSSTYFGWIAAGRGPWRYDGEIDHGYTGGVHGAGTFVVDDPDFGLYAYGGSVRERGRCLELRLSDGVCRRFFVTCSPRVGVELLQDALRGRVLVSKDGGRLKFRIANRYGAAHRAAMTLSLLPEGEYTLRCGLHREKFSVREGEDARLCVPLSRRGACVRITK